MNLKDRFSQKDVVVTAHRGFSGKYPENTLMAFERAIEAGADIIEFDLRESREFTPIILHDETIDRTSNGAGKPGEYTLEELKHFNFSHWVGPHDVNGSLDEAAYPDVTIPTFEELLQRVGRRIGLNIQVYACMHPLIDEICRLYDKYDLYEQGYLSMSSYEDAQIVQTINPDIQLCILEDQRNMNIDSLQRQKDAGAVYIQPYTQDVSTEFCQIVRDMGLCSSMFYSNTDENNRKFIGYGQQGILTDNVHILQKTITDLGLNQ